MNLSMLKSGFGVISAFKQFIGDVRGKKGQVAINAATFFIGVLLTFGDQQLHLHLMAYVHIVATFFGITDQQVVAGGGVALYGAVNWLLTVATTDKIGVTGRANPSAVVVPGAGVRRVDLDAPAVSAAVAGSSGNAPARVEGPLAAPLGSKPADAGAAPAVRPVDETQREAP